MYAARDRIGILVHSHHANVTPEWLEWDLNGGNLTRTPVAARLDRGRAFSGKGRLYAQFVTGEGQDAQVKVLDTSTGNWSPVRINLPDHITRNGLMLLGADGDNLVFRLGGGGNVHLVWTIPE